MKVAIVAVLGVLSPLVSLAQFSPEDLSQVVGDYQLARSVYGQCAPAISIAIVPTGEKGSNSASLTVGDYAFPAINEGDQEFGDRGVAFTKSESHAFRDTFTGLPVLKNHSEHYAANRLEERSEAEVRFRREGRVEVEIERHGNACGEIKTKCVFVRAPGDVDVPCQGQDQGQCQDQGKGQGQGQVPDQGKGQGQDQGKGQGQAPYQK